MKKSLLILSLTVMLSLVLILPAFADVPTGGGGSAGLSVVSLNLEPATQTVTAGEIATVTVKAYDVDGNLATINQNVYVSDGQDFDTTLIDFDQTDINYSNETAGTYTLTGISDGVQSGTAAITVIPGTFGGLDVEVPESMTVNERKPVTITLTDSYGNTLDSNEEDITIYLSTDTYMQGKFYSSLHEEYNYPTSSVTIPAGSVSTKVYYQPLGRIPNSYYGNDLYFSNGDIEVNKTINVLPAGSSFLRYDINDDEKVVSNADNPDPIKMTFFMFDQFGNEQKASSPTDLALDYYHDGYIKIYKDEACTEEITNNKLTIPSNSASASVYVISTKENEYWLEAKLPGMDYWEGTWFYFYAGPAVKVKISADSTDININQWDDIYLTSYDKFDNETNFYDQYLTAILHSSSTQGYFYDGDDELITQVSVQNGYGKPIGSWWWDDYIYFKSEVSGDITLSASVPGLIVEPLVIHVSPDQFNIYSDYYVVPEERVEIWSDFHVEANDTTLTYEAYTLNGEVKTPVGKFYDGYSSGVETTSDNGDYIYFEVPTNLAEGTIIYIKATSAALGQSAVTSMEVRKNADWGKYLNRGWNIFSTPFALSSGNDTISSIIANDEYIQIAYGYKNGQWYQMTNADTNSLKVNPLEAYYVKLSGDTNANYFGKTSPTAPPIRTLNVGWNLVSPALDVNESNYSIGYGDYVTKDVKSAFYSVWQNTKIFVSPALNDPWYNEAWSIVNMDPSENQEQSVSAGRGYWTYQGAVGELTGFSTTPVTNPGSYYGD